MSNLFSLFNPLSDRSILLENIVKIISKYDETCKYQAKIELTKNQQKLENWFSKNTYNEILFLIKETREVLDQNIKSLLHIAVISVLKNASSQDKSWGCIADNMVPKENQIKDKDVLKKVYINCKKIIRDIESRIVNNKLISAFYEELNLSNRVFNSNITTFNKLEANYIDCIITSPPYVNMTDYITSQRLAYYYLDLDPDEEKYLEIGARFKRARNKAVINYIDEMKLTNSILSSLVKTDGYFCLVLPEFNSTRNIDIERQDATNIILDDLESKLLEKRSTYERKIPVMRRSHNSFWASLEKEKIYIYQKVSK